MELAYRSCDLPGRVRLAYLEQGEGEPLLLVHGFTGTARREFGDLIAVLKQQYRVIAPDLRGYGASRPPARDFPPDFYHRDAADLAALLEALDCSPATVLGFSDGAETALLLAAGWPRRVRKVVAWGVSGVISPEMLAAVQSWLPVTAWGPERAVWRAAIVADHGPEQLESMILGWIEAARAIVAAGGDIVLGSAHHIRCPVLLINGADEVGNTRRDLDRLAARIAGCRTEIVADCGHAVHRERPDRFLELVLAFLADSRVYFSLGEE